MDTVKVAAICATVSPEGKRSNMESLLRLLDEAAGKGARLVVFPDGMLNDIATEARAGYGDPEMAQMLDESEAIPDGPSTAAIAERARQLDVYVCWGMAERSEGRDPHIYNAVVLAGPEGYIGKYRKATIGPKGTSTVKMGVRQPPVEEPPVFDTEIGKIGLQLSRDLEYDEVTYLLAHAGAQIVASPNYWPNDTGTEADARHVERTDLLVGRSKEHGVVIVDANRCGKGLDGRSMVVVPYSDEPIASTGEAQGIAFGAVKVD